MKALRPVLVLALLLAAACVPLPAPASATLPPAPTRTSPAPTSPPPTDMATAAATATAEAALDTVEPPTPEPGDGAIGHLAAGAAVNITSVNMIAAATGWAMGGAGVQGDHVLRTTDGGQTWADVTPPEPEVVGGSVSLAVEPHGYFPDADNAWVIYGASDTSVPTALLVWHTADAGATWTSSEPIDASALGVSDFFAPSDLHFVDARTGWFLAHLGVGMNHDYIAIYQTTDGGATWAPVFGPQSDGPQSCGKTGMRFVDARNGWLTGDCQGVAPGLFLYRTTDGGATWALVSLPAPDSAADLFTRDDAGCGTNSLTFFDALSAKLAVACLILSTDPIETVAFVYTTTDGGESWTASPAPSRGQSFLDAQLGWSLPLTFGFSNPPFALAHTTDGGATWSTMAMVAWYGQLDFIDANNGWAVANSSDASALVHTIDAGTTWEELTPTIAP